MTEFKSLHEAAEAYEALSKQNDDLQKQIQANEQSESENKELIQNASDEIQQLEGVIETLTEERDEAIAASRDSAEKISELESELKNREDNEWKKAAQIAAESADAPAEDLPDASAENEKTREEFEALSLSERVQFFKNGGKLV